MKIAYYIEYGHHYLDHIKALYDECPGTLITLSPKTATVCRDSNMPIYLGKKHDERLLNNINTDVVVYPGMRKIPRHNGVMHVHIRHGVSDKALIKHQNMDFDLVLLPGQKNYDTVKEIGHRMPKYKVAGYNKFCQMKDMEIPKLFNNDKKTIVYAPTWNYSIPTGTPNINSSWVFVKQICEAIGKDYNLIIKPHPIINQMVSKDLYSFLQDPAKNNIKYVSHYPSLPYMAAADMMLTDISSVAYEWLYFDKPVVFINPRPDSLREGMDHTRIWSAGLVVNDIAQLRRYIDMGFAQPKAHHDERERLLHYAYMNPRDGLAAERSINLIKEKYKEFPKQGRMVF